MLPPLSSSDSARSDHSMRRQTPQPALTSKLRGFALGLSILKPSDLPERTPSTESKALTDRASPITSELVFRDIISPQSLSSASSGYFSPSVLAPQGNPPPRLPSMVPTGPITDSTNHPIRFPGLSPAAPAA